MNSKIKEITLAKNKEFEENPNIKISPNNSFFWAFMYGICTWGKDATEDILGANQYFDGDMPIFEIGCYTLFRLDLWFFMNKVPVQIRQKIIFHICDSFLDLFIKETPLKNANAVFDNRQEIYSSKLKEGEELPIGKLIFDLEQIILKTKNDNLPTPIKIDELVLDLDFNNGIFVKYNVHSYEKHMIPALFESAKNLLSLLGMKLNE